jgi:hypothetical protein
MKLKGYERARVRAVVRGAELVLCLALGACASHELRCEGTLAPINPPAPPSAATQAQEQHGQ